MCLESQELILDKVSPNLEVYGYEAKDDFIISGYIRSVRLTIKRATLDCGPRQEQQAEWGQGRNQAHQC